MKKIFLALVLSTLAFADDYVATKTTSLSSSAEVITLQQPASSSATARLLGIYLDCSVACTYTIERDGTAATTTSLTTVSINPTGANASKALAFSASNVGTGTVIFRGQLPAGGAVIWDGTGVILQGNGTGKNVTIRTNSITGNVNIDIRWSE